MHLYFDSMNWDTREDFNGFIPFRASGMAEILFGLSFNLAVSPNGANSPKSLRIGLTSW